MLKGESSISTANVKKIRARLLGWYDRSRRDLPWRRTQDPYRIWVSEMMLQQTRVAVVLEYYRKFLEKFPTVHALAASSEADVLAAWSGLGYYRRARAMHAAAKLIVEELGGEFPKAAEELEKLPGIGRYTAAAISSIAFGGRRAVVDGNVERVLSRLTGKHLLDRREAWDEAEPLLDASRPGDWNQAMMELGATICAPKGPQCPICPIHKWCKEPGREVKKTQVLRQQKQLLYGLAQKKGSVYLVQRRRTASLMAGMWELPSTEDESCGEIMYRARHSITNSDFAVTVRELKAERARGGKWVRCSKLHELPVTGLARKILRAANLWPDNRI